MNRAHMKTPFILTCACAAALVIVSLATYKKTPSTFLDPYHSEKAGA